jgi:hypothetical protein
LNWEDLRNLSGFADSAEEKLARIRLFVEPPEMPRLGAIGFVLAPILGFAAYLRVVPLVDITRAGRQDFLFAENGIIELGTAVFFLLAGCVALRLALRRDATVPRKFRAFFVLFACTACFVGLEEMNYGQFIFGLKVPVYFAQHGTKPDLNLHNLHGDLLSDVLRDVANVLFPLACVAIPMIQLRRGGQADPSHWAYYLLPKGELITVVCLALAVSPLDKLTKWLVGATMVARPGEIQEFYWSLAACLYVWVIQKRVQATPAEAGVLPLTLGRRNLEAYSKAA